MFGKKEEKTPGKKELSEEEKAELLRLEKFVSKLGDRQLKNQLKSQESKEKRADKAYLDALKKELNRRKK